MLTVSNSFNYRSLKARIVETGLSACFYTKLTLGQPSLQAKLAFCLPRLLLNSWLDILEQPRSSMGPQSPSCSLDDSQLLPGSGDYIHDVSCKYQKFGSRHFTKISTAIYSMFTYAAAEEFHRTKRRDPL